MFVLHVGLNKVLLLRCFKGARNGQERGEPKRSVVRCEDLRVEFTISMELAEQLNQNRPD